MEPISTITSALTGLKTAIEITKIINSSDNALDKSILKSQITELMETLIETKIAVVDLKEELLNRNEEIRILNEKIVDKSNFKFAKYYYYKLDEEDKIADGPFCSNCYENQNKKVHLITNHNGIWTCNTCETTVRDNDFYVNQENIYRAMRSIRQNDY